MRIRMRIWMTLRLKNVALAPWKCGACFRKSVLSEVGRLDPAAIAEVREEAWPDVRDADELHDVLQTLIAFRDARRSNSYERSILRGTAGD